MRRVIVGILAGYFAAAPVQGQEQVFLDRLKPDQCAFWKEVRGFAEAGSFQSYGQDTVWQQGECLNPSKRAQVPFDGDGLQILEADRDVTFRMPDFATYATLEEFIERTSQNIDYRNVAVLTGLLGARIESTREELHGVRSNSFRARGEALLEERNSLRDMMARIDDLDNDLARQLRGALVSMTLSPGPGSVGPGSVPPLDMQRSIAAALDIGVETAAFRQGDSTVRELRGVVEMHYVNLDERGTIADVQSLIEQLKERKLIVCQSDGADCQMMDLSLALELASALPPDFVETLPSLFLSEALAINDAVFRAFDATKRGHDAQRVAVSGDLKENCANLRALLEDMKSADVGGDETKMGEAAQALLQNTEFGSCTQGFISELQELIAVIDPLGPEPGRGVPDVDGFDIVVYAMDASQEVPISLDTKNTYVNPLLGTVSLRLDRQADLLKGRELERRIYVSNWTDHSVRRNQLQKSIVFGVARIALGRGEGHPLLARPHVIKSIADVEVRKSAVQGPQPKVPEWLLVEKAMEEAEYISRALGADKFEELLSLEFDSDAKVAKGEVEALPASIRDMIPKVRDSTSCTELGRTLADLLSEGHPARTSELDLFVIHSGGIGKCRKIGRRWELKKFNADEALLLLQSKIGRATE